ncbi:MAG: hypothetical protein SF053_11840 [Bacteroidia bacterium]|nr:hypothetical protein [Bacteroidia bacterium]
MSQIYLKNQHVWLPAALASEVLGEVAQVFVVYDPAAACLRIAPMDHPDFAARHKASLQMLKNRNLQGDKTISVQEILIDHLLDDSDRPLDAGTDPEGRILQVIL